MKRNFILLTLCLILTHILFLVAKAPIWTFPTSTLLFIFLLTTDVFLKNKKTEPILTNEVQQRIQESTKELETAKRVQQALLAIDPPNSDKLTIAKRCVPASTLGGDFYTFINKTIQTFTKDKKNPGIIEYANKEDSLLGITIGDVAGHGVSSALVMALSSGLLGRIGFNNQSPSIILQRANIDIQKFISQSQISHVTAFYGNINLNDLILTYANAGHPPALIIHKDDSSEKLKTEGIFLGMYPDEVYEEKTYQLKSGDRVFLFTDGIIETFNKNRESFGTKRLKDLAIINKNKHVDELIEIIFQNLFEFRDGTEQKDDQTLIIIDVK